MMQQQNPLAIPFFALQERIRNAEKQAGRESGSVQLLAVSKTFPAEILRYASDLGQKYFGENYLQEALEKQKVLTGLDICWHFIGPLQSNKSRAVAENFSWLHSLDRLKLAGRLSKQRPATLPPLNICLQVNISGEVSKSGVQPHDLSAFASSIAELPNLKIRGIMALPVTTSVISEQRHSFAKVRALYEQLKSEGHPLDTLSMGMSGDLESAVAEGATIVRIGSALFGARTYTK